MFVGNGSDEVLAHTFHALLRHDFPLLFPDVTYSFYPTYCRLYEIDFIEIPLDDAMQVQVADYRRPCGAIILANPNAPTGCALSRDEIEALAADHPDQVVAVDEAYVDFGGESAVPLVARYPNLLVIQTFSKSRSLAGLRVGFAIGQRPLIEALERVKDSFNSYPLDRLAVAGAIAACEDQAWFEDRRDRIVASRERLAADLRSLGFETLPSAANFLFVRRPGHRGAELAAGLKRRSILVRHFPKSAPPGLPAQDQHRRGRRLRPARCDSPGIVRISRRARYPRRLRRPPPVPSMPPWGGASCSTGASAEAGSISRL